MGLNFIFSVDFIVILNLPILFVSNVDITATYIPSPIFGIST